MTGSRRRASSSKPPSPQRPMRFSPSTRWRGSARPTRWGVSRTGATNGPLLLLQLHEDHVEVAAGAAAPARDVVPLELVRQLEVRHGLLGILSRGERRLRMLQEEAVELGVVDEVLPL